MPRRPAILRLAILLLAVAAVAAPARADPVELMPGVTFERTIAFTPHGVAVLNVITTPRPGSGNGLYRLAAALPGGTLGGRPETLTQLQRDLSAQMTTAGINGDFVASDGRVSGLVLQAGALAAQPAAGRSSIGVDTAGTLHVDRVRLYGTWQGTGQRRTLNALGRTPAPGQYALFTPAYGPSAPVVAGAAEVVLDPFPAATPNVDLHAAVARSGSGGGEPIPPDGAVLMAAGAAAAKLRAEAAPGTPLTIRLGLQPAWAGMVDGLGGGPVLVRAGKPVFRPLEDLTSDEVTGTEPRAAVGQLADGRIALVAVDGGRPGYSVGLTSYELAKSLVGLGAVTACGLQPGTQVTAAFDGRLLSQPATRPQPLREGLLVEYTGVYASALPLPLLNGDPGRTAEPLSYRLVRPSTVTASLVGPGGTTVGLVAAAAQQPGSYTLAQPALPAEGAWELDVKAVDDLGRASEATRTFRFDTTLTALAAPSSATGRAAVSFTLARPAAVRLVIETTAGIVVRDLGTSSLAPGRRTLVWDGRLPHGSPAYSGSYLAHVYVTSAVGTSDLEAPFAFRRAR